MKCPRCGRDMQVGGLIIDGVAPGWVPLKQFNKKGLGRLLYTGLRTIGASNILLRQTKVPHAFFCQSCNKVADIFDVTNCLEDA